MSNSRKCATKYCRRITRHIHATLCSRCNHKKQKANDPVKYTFSYFRSNAKRRGKYFDLTFEQFKIFISQNDYMNLKGKTKLSLSIDRIDVTKGYLLSNIQCITLSENSKKRAREYKDGKPVAINQETIDEHHLEIIDENHPDFVPF